MSEVTERRSFLSTGCGCACALLLYVLLIVGAITTSSSSSIESESGSGNLGGGIVSGCPFDAEKNFSGAGDGLFPYPTNAWCYGRDAYVNSSSDALQEFFDSDMKLYSDLTCNIALNSSNYKTYTMNDIGGETSGSNGNIYSYTIYTKQEGTGDCVPYFGLKTHSNADNVNWELQVDTTWSPLLYYITERDLDQVSYYAGTTPYSDDNGAYCKSRSAARDPQHMYTPVDPGNETQVDSVWNVETYRVNTTTSNTMWKDFSVADDDDILLYQEMWKACYTNVNSSQVTTNLWIIHEKRDDDDCTGTTINPNDLAGSECWQSIKNHSSVQFLPTGTATETQGMSSLSVAQSAWNNISNNAQDQTCVYYKLSTCPPNTKFSVDSDVCVPNDPALANFTPGVNQQGLVFSAGMSVAFVGSVGRAMQGHCGTQSALRPVAYNEWTDPQFGFEAVTDIFSAGSVTFWKNKTNNACQRWPHITNNPNDDIASFNWWKSKLVEQCRSITPCSSYTFDNNPTVYDACNLTSMSDGELRSKLNQLLNEVNQGCLQQPATSFSDTNPEWFEGPNFRSQKKVSASSPLPQNTRLTTEPPNLDLNSMCATHLESSSSIHKKMSLFLSDKTCTTHTSSTAKCALSSSPYYVSDFYVFPS